MIEVSREVRVTSVRMQGAVCLWRVFIEQNGKRVTDCGFTREPEKREAEVAALVRRWLGLPDPSHAIVSTLATSFVSAFLRFLNW